MPATRSPFPAGNGAAVQDLAEPLLEGHDGKGVGLGGGSSNEHTSRLRKRPGRSVQNGTIDHGQDISDEGTLTNASASSIGGDGDREPGNNRSSQWPRRMSPRRTRGSTSRNLYRILDRDAPLHQSKGKWNVRHVHRFSNLTNQAKFYFWADWFHSLLYSPTHMVFLCIFLAYTSVVLAFGGMYLSVSKYAYKVFPANRNNESFCNMDIHNIMEAMYFSLSTMTTIGYGVSDYYFGDCWLPFILVLCQVFCAITVDAVAIGIIFQRLSRGRKRGRTVVFSDRAVIRRINGELYFMFRMGELMKRHLMECHVRVYCIRHVRCKVGQPKTSTTPVGVPPPPPSPPSQDTSSDEDSSFEIETNHFQVHNMRLQNPNDDLGGMLLMVLPSMIVHKIDERSPLIPSHGEWCDADGQSHSWNPPSFANVSETEAADLQQKQQSDLLSFFGDRETEIVVLVEGIDEMTSSSLQAKHSYKIEDISFDHKFAPCIVEGHIDDDERGENWGCGSSRRRRRGPTGGLDCCIIDFEQFHQLLPAPADCDSCPYVTR
jgi:hypothetical protein